MVFPLWFAFSFSCPFFGAGRLVLAASILGSIEQCGGPRQAAARYGVIVG
jgi:hypothetical protein